MILLSQSEAPPGPHDKLRHGLRMSLPPTNPRTAYPKPEPSSRLQGRPPPARKAPGPRRRLRTSGFCAPPKRAPLDENSMYWVQPAAMRPLISRDNTPPCVLAEDLTGRTLGWVSGYIPPSDTGTITYVWQVAVHCRCAGSRPRPSGCWRRLLEQARMRGCCADADHDHARPTPPPSMGALSRPFARVPPAPPA